MQQMSFASHFLATTTVCILLTVPIAAYAETALEPLNDRDLNRIETDKGILIKDPFKTLYEPVYAGSFKLYPLLELQGRYTDNVFASNVNEENDFISLIKPKIVVHKEMGRHSFELNASTEIQRAASKNSEDIENYKAGFKADLEGFHNLHFPITFNYKIDHADRADIRSGDISKTPLESESTSLSGGVIYTPGRLSLKLIGRYASLSLEDNINSFDNTTIDRDIADRDTYDVSFTGGYKFHENWMPFVQTTYQREDFKYLDAFGNDQNKTLLRGLLGIDFDYKDLIQARLGTGIDYRDYEQNTVDNSSDLAVDASITANISRRTSLSADLTRFAVTDNDIVSGLVSTKLDFGLKHELDSGLYLTGKGGYMNDDFETSRREDDSYYGGLSLQYISSPALRLALEYDYQTRDSNMNHIDFTRNVFMLRVLGAL